MLDCGDEFQIADEPSLIGREFFCFFDSESSRHRRHVIEPEFGEPVDVVRAARIIDPALRPLDNMNAMEIQGE